MSRSWSRRLGADQGSAVLELQTLGLLLLVPLVYALLVVLDVQRAMYGVSQAAREAGRVAGVTSDPALARAAADVVLRDQRIDPGRVQLQVACLGDCDQLRVDVATRVDLPYLPESLAAAARMAVPVSASHVATVDRYAESADA